MKHLPTVAGALLGFLFIASGIVVLFKLVPMPPPAEGTAAAHFMTAFGPTGYMNFVKVLEILGGILVAIPRTRNAGLLILGPILINILAFHAFVEKGKDLFSPGILMFVALAGYLMWVERRSFCALCFKTMHSKSN